jgi:pyruvate dehydrogenase E2 component (dihydrolipoamide acetyltransferase)
VPVIELFVKVGDTIKVDDAIATLESDKATMDVPSSPPAWSRKCWSRSATRSAEGSGAVKVLVEAAGRRSGRAAPAPAPRQDRRSHPPRRPLRRRDRPAAWSR